jgi:hypothetical protein
LPSAPHPQLTHAYQLHRQRYVAREVGPHAGGSRRLDNIPDVLDDVLSVGDLPQDPNLHVVDEERETLRAANFF